MKTVAFFYSDGITGIYSHQQKNVHFIKMQCVYHLYFHQGLIVQNTVSHFIH